MRQNRPYPRCPGSLKPVLDFSGYSGNCQHCGQLMSAYKAGHARVHRDPDAPNRYQDSIIGEPSIVWVYPCYPGATGLKSLVYTERRPG